MAFASPLRPAEPAGWGNQQTVLPDHRAAEAEVDKPFLAAYRVIAEQKMAISQS